MPILRASSPLVHPDQPTDADRRWLAEQNRDWDDPDGPPVLEATIAVGGRHRRYRIDLRRDLYDPWQPEDFEWLSA